uniref:Uncharacterized protein n=1 Tax=viral metagenome TaxID=1070528 RepID=A0A6C0JUN6_9ZZZZ
MESQCVFRNTISGERCENVATNHRSNYCTYHEDTLQSIVSKDNDLELIKVNNEYFFKKNNYIVTMTDGKSINPILFKHIELLESKGYKINPLVLQYFES